ncbi:tyrosine-type recombinase/integrase, partial [Campylobacterota bacterium]
MYSKFEVIKLDLNDKKGQRWFLFDDYDNPVTIANRYIHETYPNSLNTQERVAYSLRYFFEFLDSKVLHVRFMTYNLFMEYRQWIMSDRQYRGDEHERKRNSMHNNTLVVRETDVRLFLMNFIKPIYGLFFEIPAIRKSAYDDPKSKAVSINNWKSMMSVANTRNKLIYQFIYESGLRIGELFNVEYREFLNVPRSGDEEFFCFHVYVAYNKDQRKQPKTLGRPVWIRTTLAEKIKRYIKISRHENKNTHHEIFTAEHASRKTDGTITRPGDPLTYGAIYSAMKRDAKLAGLDPKTISPHKGRHSFATNLLLEGASETEVKTQMGHKSTATISIYSRGLTLKVGMAALEATRKVGDHLDSCFSE